MGTQAPRDNALQQTQKQTPAMMQGRQMLPDLTRKGVYDVAGSENQSAGTITNAGDTQFNRAVNEQKTFNVATPQPQVQAVSPTPAPVAPTPAPVAPQVDPEYLRYVAYQKPRKTVMGLPASILTEREWLGARDAGRLINREAYR